jgi:hypothetical protein
MTGATRTDAALLAGFQDGSLEPFHHADHVRVAWLYLRREPLLRAVERFSADLRRFAAAKGKPGLYHETVTWSFLFLVHERLGPESEAFPGFAVRNADLLSWKPSALDRYYRPETLASERARSQFVMPDRLAAE